MKYLKQAARILAISFLGEVLKALIPLPIPASVYGLVLMLLCLCTGILKVRAVEDAAKFFIEIMPVMFIPAAVGLTDAWPSLSPVIVPISVTVLFTTVLVMVVTGRVTQFVMKKKGVHHG